MSKLSMKLSELKTKAELYMNKRNQIMRTPGNYTRKSSSPACVSQRKDITRGGV